jgi:hypothetical protein
VILCTTRGETKNVPVHAAICGVMLTSVVLRVNDIKQMIDADPDKLREIMQNWYVRFGPE